MRDQVATLTFLQINKGSGLNLDILPIPNIKGTSPGHCDGKNIFLVISSYRNKLPDIQFSTAAPLTPLGIASAVGSAS